MWKGVDVSKWNGKADWKAAAGSGIRFAMVRAATGGRSGGCTRDPLFEYHVTQAAEAGLRVGAYLYSYAMSVEAAVSEAKALLELLEPLRGKITFPVAFDCEETAQTALGRRTLTAMANAFCKTVGDAGYRTLVYANPNWLKRYYDAEALNAPVWLAQWAKTPTWTGKYELWQYSDSGSVPGFSGNVDLNIAYTGYEERPGRAEEAIERLSQEGLIDSPGYWKQVTGGEKQASAANVAALLEKWAASLPGA
ncbi:MAG: glycoside hydrolase family 25 protein [Eubacteriales bacterium]|nr:glycoside hydrolase family 25 protein [Eubacteriales bacterium]